MTTLAEKMTTLNPERRAWVQERADELIAQERTRRARQGTGHVNSDYGPRVHTFVRRNHVRKAVKFTMGKRSFRGIRRPPGRRSRGSGYRRYVSVAR